jgi:hypothetical protein
MSLCNWSVDGREATISLHLLRYSFVSRLDVLGRNDI